MIRNRFTIWLASLLAPYMPPRRPYDIAIGGDQNPYMLRWYLIPRNRFFNVYLHQVRRSDDDRASHCHPWVSLSFMLAGPLGELIGTDKKGFAYRDIEPGAFVFRRATFAHRLVVTRSVVRDAVGAPRGYPITLFITGPKIREWGFYCPQGFRHWRDFTKGARGETVGRGCE